MSNFSDNVKSIIATVAPLLGTALAGPLGTTAGVFLAKELGKPDASGAKVPATVAEIEQAVLGGDPQTMLAIHQAEIGFKQHMADLGVQEDALVYADKDSARKREMTLRDWTPASLAWVTVGACVSLGAAVVTGNVTKDPAIAGQVGVIIGYAFGELKSVMSYYFGSSVGSDKKTDAMTAALKDQA